MADDLKQKVTQKLANLVSGKLSENEVDDLFEKITVLSPSTLIKLKS